MVLDRVLNIIADVLGVSRAEISIQSTADDFSNWDSLNMLNLAMALESAFEVNFTPDEMSEMLSVELIIETLKSKGTE